MLLDTCTYLWLAVDPSDSPMPKSLVEFLVGDVELFVSAVSDWEIAIKHAKGKLKLPQEPRLWFPRALELLDATSLPLTAADPAQLYRLPAIHSDPFDRLLICQAITNQLSICTPDPLIQAYPISITWDIPKSV